MRLNKKFILFLIPVIFWTMAAFAQTTVTANVSTGKITIGQHIQLFLEVQAKSDQTTIKWPNVVADSIKGLDWIESGKIDTIKQQGFIVYKQKLSLTGFEAGKFMIPSFQFEIAEGDKTAQIFATDSLGIEVQTVVVDTSKAFMPINDILQVESSWLDYWKNILIVLFILLLLAFLIIYFRKRWLKKKAEDTGKVPPEKAHERALRLLDELKSQKLWQSGQVKEYYALLSTILRSYLDNRFEVNAMELTTDELLKLSKQDKRIKAVRPELKRILKTADLAKYAKAEPLQVEQEACLDAAYLIIQKTKMQGVEASKK